MDFGTLLYAAHKNEKTANKDVSMNDYVYGQFRQCYRFSILMFYRI